MAIQSRQLVSRFSEEAEIKFDESKTGILHIYKSEAEFTHAKKVSILLGKAGLERQLLTPHEVYSLEPRLASKVVGGFYTPSDSTGDAHKFSTYLAHFCIKKGVHFEMNSFISDLRQSEKKVHLKIKKTDGTKDQKEFDGIIIAAGIGSRSLGQKLGDRINIYPVKGYSITVHLKDSISQLRAPQAGLLDDEAKIVTSRLGVDRFRVAGTAEINGTNLDIRADRILPLLNWVKSTFPDVSTEFFTPWAGLGPMTPNLMPFIGPGKKKRVCYNTGHGHLGWTLSCISAQMISDIVRQHYH